MFHTWAKVPISRNEWRQELGEKMREGFPNCEPLPGAAALLASLSRAVHANTGEPIELGLSSNTKTSSFGLKITKPETRALLDHFRPERRVLGDDSRLQEGRLKPYPDIYLTTLDVLNSTKLVDHGPILPEECLVIEDSIAGVEAGRRAGMRVVWVPHPYLMAEYQPREKEILAGRMNRFQIGNEWQLGEIDDGWAERITSLEQFDLDKYGIRVLA
jgi:pseudouridine-5'-monophosphatase